MPTQEYWSTYKGETGVEHLEALQSRNEDKSVLWLHSVHHHQGRVEVDYSMKVTSIQSTPPGRQCTEQINISYFQGPVLMNRITEMGGIRVERTRYRRWDENN